MQRFMTMFVRILLLVVSIPYLWSCMPPANVTKTLPITTTTVVFTTESESPPIIAVVEIDTTLPWSRAQEDPNNALVPIATQLQAAQNAHIEGAPTLVDVKQNRNLTKVITRIPVEGSREEVHQALQGAFSISDYVQGFNITSIENP